MTRRCCQALATVALAAATVAAAAQSKPVTSNRDHPSAAKAAAKAAALAAAQSGNATPVIWTAPAAVAKLDLLAGSGGSAGAPHGNFTFEAEDLHGSNPKLTVKDDLGTKWTVKMGAEARPETVASRFIWATGYYTRDDYFLPHIVVAGLPAHLRRGQHMIQPGGGIDNVRLERVPAGETKVGSWKWRQNPFLGTRPFNGLRVMMAVMNSWDLKDENNSLYLEPASDGDSPREYYVVSDLGSSFGTTGISWSGGISKGNVTNFVNSAFITRITPTYVNFKVPSLPNLLILLRFPNEDPERFSMRWVGRRVPTADAAWAGSLLAQLSPRQVRDAFRAAGYPPAVVDAFAKTMEARTQSLTRLEESSGH